MILLLIGLFLYSQTLFLVGIILFSFTTFFQLVTLPVEFNASHRAIETIGGSGLLDEDELYGARKVLRRRADVCSGAADVAGAAAAVRADLSGPGRQREPGRRP